MLDVRTLQCMTIGALSRLTKDIESRRINGFSVRLHYQQTIQAVTQRDALSMRADAKLATEICPTHVPRTGIIGPAGDILLTGATGFLGSHLLECLLRMTDRNIVEIARGRTAEDAKGRVAAALARAEAAKIDRAGEIGSRIRVVLGDIAMPRLGMAEKDWAALADKVTSVFHCAAEVDYVKAHADLKAANVLTPARSSISVAEARPRFCIISRRPSSLAGRQTCAVADDDYNAAMQGLDFGYIQSKWVAEQLVAKAEQRGINARIYRPAFISASRQAHS
jgi:thioester reductase-like protein